jgi:hypothetical protein
MRSLQQLQLVTFTALTASWAACSNTDNLAPSTLNFNRPTDIAFACYGNLRLTNGGSADPSQPIVVTAEPVEACNIRSEIGSNGEALVPQGQENLGSGSSVGTSAWYGFVLQSVPGTVGISTWATKPATQFSGINDVTVLDADPLTPGKSGITMGVQPIGLVTSSEGCYEVTANAGSCDLSALDITSALNYQFDPEKALSNNQPVRVNSLKVVNSAGIPIGAKPAAIVSQPAAGTIGVTCPATPTGLVYVAYPSCHLVAGIDLSTGTVVGGIQFDVNGVPSIVDGSVTCPDECSGGGQATPGPRPTSLDLELDPNGIPQRRVLAIGSENSNVVTIVDLDINSNPASLSTVPLQNQTGTLGVNQVKVSPSIGMGGDGGFVNDAAAPGPTMQFLYAITNDATIRVANILATPAPIECDTQVDPRYLRTKGQSDLAFLSCMPVGGATTPPRRAGAIGPGIELVNRLPAIATSSTTTGTSATNPTTTLIGGTAAITPPMGLDIFRIDGTGVAETPTTPVGYYAVATGANGQTYVINIDDDGQPDFPGAGITLGASPIDSDNVIGSAIPYDIAHQLRDALPDRGALAQLPGANGKELPICNTDGPDPDSGQGNSAGPRSSGALKFVLPTVPTTVVSTVKLGELPDIRHVQCIGQDTIAAGGAMGATTVSELSFPAQGPPSQGSGFGSGAGATLLATRDAEFPDVMGMNADEIWTLTYEGSVSNDTTNTATNGPPVRTAMFDVDSNGMSLVDETTPFCDAGAQPFDIVQIHGCDPSVGNADCPPDYDCFVHPDSQVQGIGQCIQSGEADRLATACKEFLISQRRYTVGQTTAGKLVLLPRKHVLRTTPVDGCTTDMQCQTLANYALQNNSSSNPIVDKTPPDTHAWTCMLDPARAPDLDDAGNVIKRCVETCMQDSDCDTGTVCQNGLCMEGVEPPQSCVNAPERFEIDVGEAYAVEGALSGFHHPIIADANGTCIKNPNASPFDIGRLPLRAPACDPNANSLGIGSDGVTVEANPCETTVPQWELPTTFDQACTPTTAGEPAPRQADAIIFRGPAFNLTLVDPTYPGDLNCIGDRMGNLGKIPLMPPGGSMSIRITGGFRPLLLPIQPALPGKVVRGPTNSIWVIDQGDFLSTNFGVASTSGKVYRIESAAIGVINVLE